MQRSCERSSAASTSSREPPDASRHDPLGAAAARGAAAGGEARAAAGEAVTVLARVADTGAGSGSGATWLAVASTPPAFSEERRVCTETRHSAFSTLRDGSATACCPTN